MSIKEYMKDFYKLSIRSRHNEESLESIARYVNGLSYAIQDEFNVLNFSFSGRGLPIILED